jgi:hypothetical protein
LKSTTAFNEEITSFKRGITNELYLIGSENVYLITLIHELISIRKTDDLITFQKNHYSKPYSDSSGIYIHYDSEPDYYLNDEATFMARKKYSTWYVRLKKTNRLSLFKNFSDERFLKSPARWKRVTDLGMPDHPHSIGSVKFTGSPYQFFKWQNKLVVFDLFDFRVETFDSTGKYLAGHDFYKTKDNFVLKRIFQDEFSDEFYFLALADNGKTKEIFQRINPYTGTITNVELKNKDHLTSMKFHRGYQYFIQQDGGERFLVRIKL